MRNPNHFALPSDLFRFCLKNVDTGDEIFSYENCFANYLAQQDEQNYLWQTYDRRLQALIKAVTSKRNLRILEVGCGFGHDLLWAAQAGGNVIGIDVDTSFVEITRRTKSQIEAFLGRRLNAEIFRTNLLELDGHQFDFIFMKDVFHHLEPRKQIVKKIGEILAPGGFILIIEPNFWNPLIQCQMFRIRGFNTLIKKTDPETNETYFFGNERLVSGWEINARFKSEGIKGTVRHIRLVPTKLAANPYVTRVARTLESIGLDQFLKPACIHMIYSGKKLG